VVVGDGTTVVDGPAGGTLVDGPVGGTPAVDGVGAGALLAAAVGDPLLAPEHPAASSAPATSTAGSPRPARLITRQDRNVATTLRTETDAGVRSIILTRAAEYNTITPALRDELAEAIDQAEADAAVRVILLRADGPAFCAGYGLDWSTAAQATEADRGGRVWDSVADLRMMRRFVDTYLKLFYAAKPTIAAVQGWCVAGGTDLVLCADIVVAGEGASFGYPPSRVWGTPTTAMWVYRLGLERAKRYLLTGDEIPAPEAARVGLILEAVPDDELQDHAMALAKRMAQVPTTQLVMLKLLCNQTVENMGMASSRLVGTLFDGIARHTQEGLDFVARSQEIGFREAVRERDNPFGDYGSRR
jgi:enoyl-CoA hydratase